MPHEPSDRSIASDEQGSIQGVYRVELEIDADLKIVTCETPDWRIIELPLSGRREVMDVIQLHAQLVGLAKFVSGSAASAFSARVELLKRTELSSPLRVTASTRSMKAAQLLWQTTGANRPAESFFVDEQVASLKEACEATGWPWKQRTDGSLTVELETRREIYSVQLTGAADGAVRIFATLANFQEPSRSSLEAIALALLAAGNSLRLARGALAREAHTVKAGLEVVFSNPPSAQELSIAFQSLSAGCDFCGPEVAALGDEELARHYLGMQSKPDQ